MTACLALSGLGAAFAQNRPDDATSPDAADGAAVEGRQRANLTGPEQVTEGEEILTRGSQISRRVASMLDEARRERDMIRITCLNDKLTQVNANINTTETRLEALREAVQTNDDGRRNHEYTVMSVLGQKFRTLEQEANQCIGQDVYDTGSTRIVTTIDPGTPTEDPTVMPTPPVLPQPYIPPPASGVI